MRSLLVSLTLLASLTACGDDDDITPPPDTIGNDGAGDGPMNDAAPPDTLPPDSEGIPDGVPPDGIVTTGFTIDIDGVSIFADCQPIVAMDPWNISMMVTYSNGDAIPETAVITNANLRFESGLMDSMDLTFNPPSSGVVPAGLGTTVMHDKVTASDIASDCSYCGTTATLAVDWMVGAATVSASRVGLTVECAF